MTPFALCSNQVLFHVSVPNIGEMLVGNAKDTRRHCEMAISHYALNMHRASMRTWLVRLNKRLLSHRAPCFNAGVSVCVSETRLT